MGKLLTTKQAAAEFDYVPGTISEFAKRGIFPVAARVGPYLLFRRADIKRGIAKLAKRPRGRVAYKRRNHA